MKNEECKTMRMLLIQESFSEESRFRLARRQSTVRSRFWVRSGNDSSSDRPCGL